MYVLILLFIFIFILFIILVIDHESKENIDNDDLDDAGNSSTSDIFLTPIPIRESKSLLKSESATHNHKPSSGYVLRKTPLRDLYQNGATPLHIPGLNIKLFGNRKSIKKDCLKKNEALADNFQDIPLTPSKRETYDVTDTVIENLQKLDLNNECVTNKEINVNDQVDGKNK